MSALKSVSGVVHLPDTSVSFYLNFGAREPQESHELGYEETAKKMGRILDQASELSPEMREVLVGFAEFLAQKTGK